MKARNITGQVFGRLTAIESIRSHGKRTAWRCECACGNSAADAIRNLYSSGRKLRDIAREVGCGYHSAWKVVHNIQWARQ